MTLTEIKDLYLQSLEIQLDEYLECIEEDPVKGMCDIYHIQRFKMIQEELNKNVFEWAVQNYNVDTDK